MIQNFDEITAFLVQSYHDAGDITNTKKTCSYKKKLVGDEEPVVQWFGEGTT